MIKNFEDLPVCLTVDDLRAALKISRAKAYELVHSQGFPAIRVGRTLRIPKALLQEWMRQQTADGSDTNVETK